MPQDANFSLTGKKTSRRREPEVGISIAGFIVIISDWIQGDLYFFLYSSSPLHELCMNMAKIL